MQTATRPLSKLLRSQPPREATSQRRLTWPRALIVLVLAMLACTLLRDFWYPDEPDMAEIVRQMLLRRDWLQLWLYQKPFDDYPPLYFWIVAGVARALGFAEPVLRLPTTLACAGLLAATGAWTQLRFGARVALWTVVVMGSSWLVFTQAIHMHLDMLLAAFVAASILSFDVATVVGPRKSRFAWWCTSAIAMSAAAWTNGPIGIVLPCGALGLSALMTRDVRALARLSAIGAAATAAFVAWAALFARQSGSDGLLYFLSEQNLARFLGGRSHEHPFHYYALNVWIDFLPWAPLLVPALVAAWRQARGAHAGQRLALCWLVFGAVFLSAAASKRSVYFLPLAPALAIVIGSFVAELERAGAVARSVRWLLGSAAIVMACAGVAVLASTYWLASRFGARADLLIAAVSAAAVLLASAATLLRRLRQGGTARFLALLPAGTLAAYVIVWGGVLPLLDEPLSAKADALWLRERAASSVAYFEPGRAQLPKESSALSFYGGFAIRPLSGAELHAFAASHPQAIVLVKSRYLADLSAQLGAQPVVERELIVGRDHFFAVGL